MYVIINNLIYNLYIRLNIIYSIFINKGWTRVVLPLLNNNEKYHTTNLLVCTNIRLLLQESRLVQSLGLRKHSYL